MSTFKDFLEKRDRLTLVVAPIVLILFLIVYKCDSNKCDPIDKRVFENLNKLFEKNSIVRATLKNGRYQPIDSALDSLVISDQETLEYIRFLILDKKFIKLNRYSSVWTAELILTLSSGTKLKVDIQRADSKSDNDDDYKLYFYEGCAERFNYGSRDLGLKIKELIENRAR